MFNIGLTIAGVDLVILSVQWLLWVKTDEDGKLNGWWQAFGTSITVVWYLNLAIIGFYLAMLTQVARSNQTKYCTWHKHLFKVQLHLCYILGGLWVVKVLSYAFRWYMNSKKEALV